MTQATRTAARPHILRLAAHVGDPGETWKPDAACAGHPRPNIFHPPPARLGTQAALRRSQAEQRRKIMIAEAKTVCRQCRVRFECLAYAVARDDRYGIWGGYTSQERGYKREDR